MSSFSAHYDEDGNIILGASDDAVASTDDPTPAPSFPERADREAMLLFGAPIETYDGGSQRIAPVRNEWSKTRNLLSDVLKEGQREFDVTHDEFRSWYRVSFRSVAEFPVTLKQALGRLVSFLTHPFTFRVRYTAPVKPRSRTTLFVIDSIRFGGTFATIFVSLYVALNLGSFWNIAKAQLALSDDTERVGALAQLTHGNQEQANDGTIAIPHAMASDGNEEHALDAHLPLVGPPDNRLVIPKLGENIPIVIPHHDVYARTAGLLHDSTCFVDVVALQDGELSTSDGTHEFFRQVPRDRRVSGRGAERRCAEVRSRPARVTRLEPQFR
jgi:hypothetical protein